MSAQSSSAQNRTLQVWLQKIEQGEIKLPRFQRFEAWDSKRICSLLDAIIKNLPLGATLIHQVGVKEQFVSRYLATAPEVSPNGVNEHLLDGQQRLTSIYRALRNNYDYETYFVYLHKYDTVDDKYESDENTVFFVSRYDRKDKVEKYPLWANNAEKCFKKGLIPMQLFHPLAAETEKESWIAEATLYLKTDAGNIEVYYQTQNDLRSQISKIRETINYYNLPHLTLPQETPKDVALRVFINMNTNTKPLSAYDVVVAEVESAAGVSLHDMQDELEELIPDLASIEKPDYLILATSAILQDKQPYAKGMLSMDYHKLVENWGRVKKGLNEFVDFVKSQGIFHKKLMPSTILISGIAAILSSDFKNNDEKGKTITLLRKYMWSSFLTDRYESSPITKLMQDYKVLKAIVNGDTKEDGTLYTESDVPALNRDQHAILTSDEFKQSSWPTRENMKARSLMCMCSMLGAQDWSTGQVMNIDNLKDREFHHIFPVAYLNPIGINPHSALNAVLISSTTNRNLGAESPFTYLMNKFDVHNEQTMSDRLRTHLVSPYSIQQGSLIDTDKEIIQNHYDAFLNDRAELAVKAAEILCNGEVLTIARLFNNHTGVAMEYTEMDKDVTLIEDKLREIIVNDITTQLAYKSLNEIIPQSILDRAKAKFKSRQKKLAVTGEEKLDLAQAIKYMTLGEYQDVITRKNIWPVFESYFESSGNLRMRTAQLGTCRNIIRHGNSLTPVEKSDGEAAIYWFKSALKIN